MTHHPVWGASGSKSTISQGHILLTELVKLTGIELWNPSSPSPTANLPTSACRGSNLKKMDIADLLKKEHEESHSGSITHCIDMEFWLEKTYTATYIIPQELDSNLANFPPTH